MTQEEINNQMILFAKWVSRKEYLYMTGRGLPNSGRWFITKGKDQGKFITGKELLEQYNSQKEATS